MHAPLTAQMGPTRSQQWATLALVLDIVYLTLIYNLKLHNITNTTIFSIREHVVGDSRYAANICGPEKQVLFLDAHFFAVLTELYSEADWTVFSHDAQNNVPCRNITAANRAGHQSSKQNPSFLCSVICYRVQTFFVFLSRIEKLSDPNTF